MHHAKRRFPLATLTSALLFVALTACGGGGGGDDPATAPAGDTPPATTPPATTPPGTTPPATTPPGAGTPQQQLASRFNAPDGVARDSAGNLYVADRLNATIRKITPAGAVSTLAGTAGQKASTDGQGAAARFTEPRGIAVAGDGTVYVVDGNTVRRVGADGRVLTILDNLNNPWGIAVDSADSIYVADTGNNRIVKGMATGVISTLATGLTGPQGVAVDATGNLYVTDVAGPATAGGTAGRTTIRKISAAGAVTTFAGADAAATFTNGAGIAVDATGNVFFVEPKRVIKLTATGASSVLPVPAAQVSTLKGVAIGAAGDLYVSDSGNHTVSKVTQAGAVTTVAGKAGETGTADAAAPTAAAAR